VPADQIALEQQTAANGAEGSTGCMQYSVLIMMASKACQAHQAQGFQQSSVVDLLFFG
jgi:hypothetical protein